ncbi:MAG TPA: malate synthase G, partial [Rhizobiaceae bacterium]|nr:malate synthase G [Rhizobiaceae bacterium]
MTGAIETHGLTVDSGLKAFIDNEALAGLGIGVEAFWSSFSQIAHDLAPKNRALLKMRDDLQAKIDAWHRENGAPADLDAYKAFLADIGYLVPEGPDFRITTENVDPEIASVAGPQLVVPIMNARFALNAANARWGSLYDALYGTDALGDKPQGGGYDPERGARVIRWAKAFLDSAAPLTGANWADVTDIDVDEGELLLTVSTGELFRGRGEASTVRTVTLANPSQYAGHAASEGGRANVLLRNNGLHIEILRDRSHPIGRNDPALIADVLLESALTTIMDCEDSVAAVDAADKTLVYRNWLGLMTGGLTETFMKDGREMTRRLNPDREYEGADGRTFSLHGRSLMLVRNVGHLMTNPAIRLSDGSEIPEGIMDAMVTALIALYDIGPHGRHANSRAGSMYVVKPKMHGPEEV